MGDRISALPQPILSLLSQNDAVRTSVLSKSWGCLWTTRPNLEFRQSRSHFRNKRTFLSVVDKTLQRYHDQNLSIHELCLEMWMVDSDPVSLLKKWIPVLRIFNLCFLSETMLNSDTPLAAVFEAEALQKLYLERCRLNLNSLGKAILCKHLHTLRLVRVDIADETFKKIISSCPLIEYMILHKCAGLRVAELSNLHYLKCFDFTICGAIREDDDPSIEIDAPTIETIKIHARLSSFHHHKYFPRLKSLSLKEVTLSSQSFDFFSWDLPSLEYLDLKRCDGDFEDFHLLSRSIKHLSIIWRKPITWATIDAPNILYFQYSSNSLPSIFSFTTTCSREWKSNIRLDFDSIDDSSWFLKLYEVLKALSRSEISLYLQNSRSGIDENVEEVIKHDIYGGLYEPVIVEHLHLNICSYSSPAYSAFRNGLFLICRPRNLDGHHTLRICARSS